MQNNVENKDLDHIDIFDWLSLCWEKKKTVFYSVLVFALLSVLIALSLPNKFTSSALLSLSPERTQSNTGTGSLFEFSAIQALGISNTASGINLAFETMTSKDILKEIIDLDGIREGVLAAKRYDPRTKKLEYNEYLFNAAEKKWVRNPPKGREVIPTYQELHSALKGSLIVTKDERTNFISISYEHLSPEFAKYFLDSLIDAVNKKSREEQFNRATLSIEYLEEEAMQTNQLDTLKAIGNLIESNLTTKVLANVQKDFLLTKVEAPLVAEIRSSPNRSLFCIIFTLFGFFITCSFLIIQHYLRGTKMDMFISQVKQDVDKFQNIIKKYIPFNKK